MYGQTGSFKDLFKKYRLKAEFSSLSDLGNALAEKGFNYEDSIFSHWQKGSRIPQYRILLLKLLEIFVERKAITSVNDANEFLKSANQGYLSEEEIKKLSLEPQNKIFQVPNEIINFTGREDVINDLVKKDVTSKVILIHGPAGVGKTALAIKLGHLLKDKFSDGVLWYKIEEDNVMDILLSVAKILGEDISEISDLQVRGTVVRSLLAGKNILLFLDSGELYPNIAILIPNSKLATVIITSQKSHLKAEINFIDIGLKAFTTNETLSLFKNVLKEKYARVSKSSLLKIAGKVGNLPLALHLLAGELLNRKTLPGKENTLVQDLYNTDNNLNSAISLSYEKLNSRNKSVLLSASIFKGKDFSLDSIAYINGLSKSSTQNILEHLIDLSLIEHSTKNRFRIHPAIKDFIRNKLDYPRSSYLSLIAVLIFIFFSSWWVFLQLFVDKNDFQYYAYGATYGFMALYGGVCGIHTSLNWGGLKTLIGKAIFVFSVGLFMQEFGQLTYSYYNIFHNIQVPYPSIGDIGYIGCIPVYIYAALLIAKSSGISINLKSLKTKIIALLIPLTMVLAGYLLLLPGYIFDWHNPVKIILDFGQPIGDAIVISIAIVIFIFSRNILDGIMRSKALFILLALTTQFVADYSFILTSDSYYPGNYVDFIFLIAYLIMTLALLSFRSLNIKVKNA